VVGGGSPSSGGRGWQKEAARRRGHGRHLEAERRPAQEAEQGAAAGGLSAGSVAEMDRWSRWMDKEERGWKKKRKEIERREKY
jgi:hypothetical protein